MNILLVEDSDSEVFLLRKFLAKKPDAPCVVERVADGEQALDYLFHRKDYKNTMRPDAVVLDLGLPRVTGYDVLNRLKETEPHCDVPVIVLTTSRSLIDKERCMALGARAYFSKPNNLQGYEELVTRLVDVELPQVVAGA